MYITEKYDRLNKYFRNTKYQGLLEKATLAVSRGSVEEFEEVYKQFPTEEQLLESFLDKLKDKPVYKTLKKIGESKTETCYETLKGLFSLGTHLSIACEHGELEYRMVLDSVYHRIGIQLYETVITN